MTSFQSTSQPTLFCTCEGLHILCLHYLMLAMLQKMQSGHKGNYQFIHCSRTFERRIPKEPSWNFTPILNPEVSKAPTLRAGLFHKIIFYVRDLLFLLNPIPGTRSGNMSAPEISLKCQLTTSFWFLFAITIHQKSHPNFDCWLVFDHGSP